jgi:hypothetical protein
MLGILFLAANPTNTTALNLDEEIRNIRRKIRATAFREIQIEQEWAVSPADLVTYLQEHQPTIVHFSGHGTARGEIVLQDKGSSAPMAPDILSDIFKVLQGGIKCVVLNSCYSEMQAKAIKPYVDCVVGMSQAVGDEVAIQFAGTFYEALANGRTIREAYELGRAIMRVIDPNQSDVPILLERSIASADTCLVLKPDLFCEFHLDKKCRPSRSADDKSLFEIRASIRNAPADTFCVMYQLNKFHERDEFNTVGVDQKNFEIYFDCAFDFEIRATLWRLHHNGIGLRSGVVEALAKSYVNEEQTIVNKAIAEIRDNID